MAWQVRGKREGAERKGVWRGYEKKEDALPASPGGKPPTESQTEVAGTSAEASTAVVKTVESGTEVVRTAEDGTAVVESAEAATGVVEAFEADATAVKTAEAGTAVVKAAKVGTAVGKTAEAGAAEVAAWRTMRRELRAVSW